MLEVKVIHTGYLKLDGGAMFGVVPKRMWEKLNPPDEHNLCTWSMRALLVDTGTRKILIDTGIGNKQDAKFRAHFEPHGAESLFGSLQQAGLQRADITDVFLTHLHFDHCGGALFRNETTGETELSFPNAVYWSNKRHWDWAIHPNAREKASFLPENILPLQEKGRVQFIDVRQNIQFLPGFRIQFFYGHTEAMMAPVLQTDQGTVFYCADTIPSQWHVGLPYVMAYDIRPLVSLREKARLLKAAALKNYLLVFEHDPVAEAGRVKFDAAGRIVLDRAGTLEALGQD